MLQAPLLILCQGPGEPGEAPLAGSGQSCSSEGRPRKARTAQSNRSACRTDGENHTGCYRKAFKGQCNYRAQSNGFTKHKS